jgi:Phosphotransferase enzyme family
MFDAGRDDAPEVPLVGGRSTAEVVRKGDTVRRTAGPWAPTVDAYLEWILAHGFTGCPRPLGFDQFGRQVLTFIEGDTLGTAQSADEPVRIEPWPVAWRSEQMLRAVARLIRELHDAAAGFVPVDPVWRMTDRAQLPGMIICHRDLGPWNLACRGPVPVAFLDWDSCGPEMPLVDLAAAAWNFIPLARADAVAACGFSERIDLGARLRCFLDGYGADPRGFLRALQAAKERQVENVRFFPGLDPSGAAVVFEQVADDLRFLKEIAPEIGAALSD